MIAGLSLVIAGLSLMIASLSLVIPGLSLVIASLSLMIPGLPFCRRDEIEMEHDPYHASTSFWPLCGVLLLMKGVGFKHGGGGHWK